MGCGLNSCCAVLLCCYAVLLSGCSGRMTVRHLQDNSVGVQVLMASDAAPASVRDPLLESTPEDRIAVVDTRGQVLIMDAVKDDESGEMIISQRLQAVVVEASFKHVAERNGYVDIAFDVKVPKELQRSQWQVRLEPSLYYLQDTLKMEKILVTGEKYRKGQLRGYELYNRFLNSIIPDSCDFVATYTYRNQLEMFIRRHFKEVYTLRGDTSIIDQARERSLFGVSVQQALEHYTRNILLKRNGRRKDRVGKKYSRYVKVPFETHGVRLDSVICMEDSMLVYRYVQRVKSRRDLKRIDLVMAGQVYKEDKVVYDIPPVGPLTYYISSMTFFADRSLRYVKKIISRNAVANTAAYIDFKVGDASLCDTLHNNKEELSRIKGNVAALFSDTSFIIDSLIIISTCSPEGSWAFNEKLAKKRGDALRLYFLDFADSLTSGLWNIDLTGGSDADKLKECDTLHNLNTQEQVVPDLEAVIQCRSIPENWEQLERILQSDTSLADREAVWRAMALSGYDEREKALSKTKDYPYIRGVVYPLLRTVKFDFHLHRKGMIKDTVHTTEIDTLYMKGVDCLMERDYETAVTLLRPYNDINTAIAYICLDYNHSAMQVLQGLPKSPQRDYMLAVVWARQGDERKAVEYFVHAVEKDPSMRHRGNLDPEISALMRKYNLDSFPEDDINLF